MTAQSAAHVKGLEQEAELVAEIDTLRVREQEAVAEAVATDPSRSAYRPNSPAELIRRKREAAQRRLDDLREFELPARQRVAADAQAVERAKVVRDATVKARRLDAAEEKALDRAAAAFAEFVAAWHELHDAARAREAIEADLDAGGHVPQVSGERALFRRPFMATVQPFPADPEILFNRCALAVTEPHAETPYFAQRFPDAAPFAVRLRDLRESHAFRRAELRFSPVQFHLSSQVVEPLTSTRRAGGETE
jgi:hypothetical protein